MTYKTAIRDALYYWPQIKAAFNNHLELTAQEISQISGLPIAKAKRMCGILRSYRYLKISRFKKGYDPGRMTTIYKLPYT